MRNLAKYVRKNIINANLVNDFLRNDFLNSYSASHEARLSTVGHLYGELVDGIATDRKTLKRGVKTDKVRQALLENIDRNLRFLGAVLQKYGFDHYDNYIIVNSHLRVCRLFTIKDIHWLKLKLAEYICGLSLPMKISELLMRYDDFSDKDLEDLTSSERNLISSLQDGKILVYDVSLGKAEDLSHVYDDFAIKALHHTGSTTKEA